MAMNRDQIGSLIFQTIITAFILIGVIYAYTHNMLTTAYLEAYWERNSALSLLSNFVIAFLGVPAIYLSQSRVYSLERWASILGLIAQPFWFIMAMYNEAWGVFIMCFFYTHAWWSGFRKYWLLPQ